MFHYFHSVGLLSSCKLICNSLGHVLHSSNARVTHAVSLSSLLTCLKCIDRSVHGKVFYACTKIHDHQYIFTCPVSIMKVWTEHCAVCFVLQLCYTGKGEIVNINISMS